jgi:short-subunit dehydrogenase
MAKVLITGTSRGLGRALAIEMNRRKYEVIASARNINDIQDLDFI